jgi:hypothetical protein
MSGDNRDHAFHDRDVVILSDGLIEDGFEECLVVDCRETPLARKRGQLCAGVQISSKEPLQKPVAVIVV